MPADGLSSEEDVARTYCAGASGIGAVRAGAAFGLAGWRGCVAAAGLRGGAGAALAPVVSWGAGAAGSAVMMLTGGIEFDEGKYRLFGDFAGEPGDMAAAATGGGLPATGRPPAAGQPAA